MGVEIHIRCPVTGCSYEGEIKSVAAHVSGKKDSRHDWGNLGYEGANDFKSRLGESVSGTESTIVCPVDGCSYENAVASVAAHISGKKDSAHDWARLGYQNSREFKEEYGGEILKRATTVLHMTDTHIGKKQGGYGRRKWPVNCELGFERAIDVALEDGVDAVLHTGDIFHNDRHGITDEHLAFVRSQLERLHQRHIPFYYVRGDHARREGRRKLKTLERASLCQNLSCSPTVVNDEIALYGVNYHKKEWWENPNWQPKPTSLPALLALHQSVSPFTKSTRAECDLTEVLQQFKRAGGPVPSIVTLGHLHREINQDDSEYRVVCSGSTERLGARKSAFDPYVGMVRSRSGNVTYKKRTLT